jgi:hypothetical protein
MIDPFAYFRVYPTAIFRQKIHKVLYAVVIDGVDDLPFKPPTVQQARSLKVSQVSRHGRNIDAESF